MKLKLFFFGFFCAAVLSGAEIQKDPALLFEADFDSYSITANYSKGDPKSTTFTNPSLQLRMWPGIKEQGNALALEKTEQCAYPIKGNFDPRQGTVSLWISPLNWKPSAKTFQWFFTAYQSGFTMHVYKYIWPNYLFFYIQYDKAPGSTNTFVASTRIYDADWGTGKWHKLDAVWDSNDMRIYVDGILPKPEAEKNSAPTHPHWKFNIPMQFPSPSDTGKIALGNLSNEPDKSDRTAFDNVRIYNRPLSAKEINDEYVKYYPSTFGAKPERPSVAIPKTDSGSFKLDGRLDSGEWENAAALLICEEAPFSKNKEMKLNGKVYLRHDGTNLYIGLFSDKPAALQKQTVRDSNIWEDDSFELYFLSKKNNAKIQIAINPNGAVFDQKNGDIKWNSNLRTVAFSGKDFWSAEIIIPLADLGGFSDDMQGNFYISNLTNHLAAAGWSKPGGAGYNSPECFGNLLFRNDNTAFRLNSLGTLENGSLELKTGKTGSDPLKFDISIEQENGVKTVFTGDLVKTGWTTTLPVGRQHLTLSAADQKGKNVYTFDHYYYVNYPLELKYDCRPSEKKIVTSINLNNAGIPLAEALSKGALKGTLKLLSPENITVSEVSFSTSKTVFSLDLPLPAGLKKGKYKITGELDFNGTKLENSITFSVPDMTPYKVRAGMDHSVPAPWLPVKIDGKIFRVIDREYIFGEGPFPEQIVSRGSKLFVRPPALSVDGLDVVWSDFKIRRNHGDYAELSGQGKNDRFAFTWKGELWFDGMYKVDWDMNPLKAGEKITAMNFTYSIPAEFGKYVFRQAYNEQLDEWKNNRIEKCFNPIQKREDSLIWLSGIEKGLAWACVSNANWVNRLNENNILLERKNDIIAFCAKIISKPSEVNKRLWYTFIFQGTPARSPLPNWRDTNYGGYGVPTRQNLQFGGGGDATFADYNRPDTWTTPSNHKLRWPDRYRKSVAEKLVRDNSTGSNEGKTRRVPIRTINYVMPMHLGTNEPEFDYFYNEWVTLPTCVWSYKVDGMPHTIYACCGQTGITDFALYQLEEMFKMNPSHSGIYNDCSHSLGCENTRHGCGGIDAFGQKYSTTTMLGQREYMMREFKIIRKYNKTLVNHVPAANFIPFVYDFSDFIWPGEEFYSGFGENPDYFYCEGISKEAYQSAFNPVIRGVGIILLPQPERAAGGIAHLKSRQNDFATNPEWAIRTMSPALIHDFAISAAYLDRKTVDRWWIIKDAVKLAGATFHGYWFDDTVKSDSKDVYASWYELPAGAPYKYLIIAANMGRTEQPLMLTHKFNGISQYHDLWNDRVLSGNDLKSTPVKSNHFLIIGIK